MKANIGLDFEGVLKRGIRGLICFLMVLTATGNYAYRREDGVYIVPIGCLKN